MVKLPKRRVDELVRAGEGTPFDANKGETYEGVAPPGSSVRTGHGASLAREALDATGRRNID